MAPCRFSLSLREAKARTLKQIPRKNTIYWLICKVMLSYLCPA